MSSVFLSEILKQQKYSTTLLWSAAAVRHPQAFLAPTLQRGSNSGHSGVTKPWPLERPDGVPTLERGNETQAFTLVSLGSLGLGVMFDVT